MKTRLQIAREIDKAAKMAILAEERSEEDGNRNNDATLARTMFQIVYALSWVLTDESEPLITEIKEETHGKNDLS